MNMKVENEMALPTTKSVAVMLLEPYAGKLARTVLRGESSRKGADLLDYQRELFSAYCGQCSAARWLDGFSGIGRQPRSRSLPALSGRSGSRTTNRRS